MFFFFLIWGANAVSLILCLSLGVLLKGTWQQVGLTQNKEGLRHIRQIRIAKGNIGVERFRQGWGGSRGDKGMV